MRVWGETPASFCWRLPVPNPIATLGKALWTGRLRLGDPEDPDHGLLLSLTPLGRARAAVALLSLLGRQLLSGSGPSHEDETR